MKQLFTGILQNWLKDPQKWLPIDKWSVKIPFWKAEGERLWILGEASDTNLADLVLKVVLRINGYIIVQNINWIFWFLICLHAERQMYQTYNHHMTDNTVAHDADFFFTFAPFAALIIT